MQNRYTGAFKIVAHPEGRKNIPVAMLELNEREQAGEQDILGVEMICAVKTHDLFMLSPFFNESDAGFKHQLLMDIKGITPDDADVVVEARNALRTANLN